jgi:hypothetical protein
MRLRDFITGIPVSTAMLLAARAPERAAAADRYFVATRRRFATTVLVGAEI